MIKLSLSITCAQQAVNNVTLALSYFDSSVVQLAGREGREERGLRS